MAEAAFRLIVKTGPNPGTAFDLTKEVTLVGRDVTNDITVGDSEISRQHARFTRTPGGYVIEDLGSTNGSTVNGERLVAPRVLSPGDLLGMGENVTLIFEATSPEAAQTVMGGAVRHGAAPSPEVIQARAPQAAAAAPLPIEPAPRGGAMRWVLAGAGCLVLIGICAGTLYIMDTYFPEILYAPFRMFGFSG
ncbi:MAG: FHA domain-containing protein [Anaerolineales bacterium]